MCNQLEVMITLSLHDLSVIPYIPVKFLARGKHLPVINIFLYIHVIYSVGDDTFKNVNTLHPCNIIYVEVSHPST